MSSTSRGYERHVSDFYVTPKEPVELFFNKLKQVERQNWFLKYWLDPCCGGDAENPATYTEVVKEMFNPSGLMSLDIRTDSKADVVCDYLAVDLSLGDWWLTEARPDVIVANPPFNLAMPFIEKALDDVSDGGYVIMLLRLNFFGSRKRFEFFNKHMPKYTFIHHKRISFFPQDIVIGQKTFKKGSTDSCEYAHFVWQKGYSENYSKTFVI